MIFAVPINFQRAEIVVIAGRGGGFIPSPTTIELRRRLSNGLRVQANYVWSKAMSNAYASSSVVFAGLTQRESGLDLAKNVQAFDILHRFKMDATYDLPFGRGKTFFSQKEIKVGKGPNVVNYLPDDTILNTQRAFDINVSNANGYGTGGPSGRFIAPAGYGNCQQRFAGECGFNNLIVYGPSFFKFDVSVAKKFIVDEKRNFEFRATFLDALNMPNFRVGGFDVDTVFAGVGGATFGQLGNGSAYQDISTTNDPGGRLIDLMLGFNF